MKKWLIVLFILIGLFLLTAYIIIPSKLTVSSVTLLKANPHAAYRSLITDSNWEKLFGKKVAYNTFEDNNTIVKVNKKLLEGVEVLIREKDSSLSSVIELLPMGYDSCGIKWTTTIHNDSNPFKKIDKYFTARAIKKSMTGTLDNMKGFFEKEENVYGINVKQSIVRDTLLIATKSNFKRNPSTKDIYGLINVLENYAKQNTAEETAAPMLNIKMIDSSNFEAMVALPVNKFLNDHETILHKEMVAGNILVTEVKGGPYTISKGFKSLDDYVKDRDLQSPAIPFQSLITNRLNEPDTTKWITKIYYPIY